MPVTILIADDHAVVRDGLKMIIESHDDLRVVGMAVNGRDAIELAERLHPDVIFMDIAMPDLNGIEATLVIRRRLPSARIVVLSMHHTNEHVFRAVQAGANGYVLKEAAGSHVVRAIRAVMKGQRYFCDGVEPPDSLLSGERRPPSLSPLDTLSPREREVLQLVVEGRTSVEIAAKLSLSPKSVETYRSRLMQKLDIDNIPLLVKFALQHGITPVE